MPTESTDGSSPSVLITKVANGYLVSAEKTGQFTSVYVFPNMEAVLAWLTKYFETE